MFAVGIVIRFTRFLLGAHPTRLLKTIQNYFFLEPSKGIKPSPNRVETDCSIQLSYEGLFYFFLLIFGLSQVGASKGIRTLTFTLEK